MVKRNIGHLLRYYRELSKLTQTEVAKKMSVSQNTVSSWESDRSEPDIGTVQKLSEIYNAEVSDLLGVVNVPVTPDEQKIIEIIRSLSEDKKKQLESYLDYLISMQKNACNHK